jgi:hypothetical protein
MFLKNGYCEDYEVIDIAMQRTQHGKTFHFTTVAHQSKRKRAFSNTCEIQGFNGIL